MKDRLFVLLPVALIVSGLIACGDDVNKVADRRKGITLDSSVMYADLKPGEQVGQTNVVVTIETSKKGISNDDRELQFGMDDNFELIKDSVVFRPVFVQPVASGVSKKYIYLLSFETENSNPDKNVVLRLLPNKLIGTTINYKLE